MIIAFFRCFCYDGNGKRIFGQEFSTRAKDMTCGKQVYSSNL